MYFDKQELQDLEAVFLDSRDVNDLAPLYDKLIIATGVILYSYMRRKNLTFNIDKRNEIIHDAVCRLLEMYLKHPEQPSIPLAGRIYWEIIFRLHNKKVMQADKLYQMQIPIHHPAPEIPLKEYEDAKNVIMDDDRLYYKMIMIDLYKNRYYKRAILAIEKYTKRYIIYEYAIELKQIWDTLHWSDRNGK